MTRAGCILVMALLGTVVRGQDIKPDPPRPNPKPHPDAKYVVTEDLMATFLRDFEAQGSPRVVIVASGARANGIDNVAFAREVSRVFGCDGQIDVISPATLGAAVQREIEMFRTKRHPHAAQLAKLKVHADYAIRIRCVRHEARPDRPWLVSVSIFNLGSGRELSYVPQPMPAVWSVTSMNKFSHYFVSKTFRNLMRRWVRRGAATDVLVSFVNLNSYKHVKAAKERMAALPGVSSVRLDSSTDVAESKTTLFRARFKGSTDDFYLELLAAFETDFPVKIRGTDLRPNAIVLTASPKADEGADRRRELFGKALEEAYRKAGRPRVVVMVNSSTELASDKVGRARVVVEHPPALYADTRGWGTFDQARADREIELRKRYANTLLEDAVYKRLLKLKIKCVDGRTPRLAMLGKKASITTTEGETIKFIRERKLADILFSSVGHYTRPPGGPQNRGLVTYTFRAVQVADDQVLGTGSIAWGYDELRAYYSGKTEGGLPRAADKAAEKVLRSIFESLVPAWSAPVEVRVTVKNAPDESSFRALGKFLEQNSESVKHSFGFHFTDLGESKTAAVFTLEVDGGTAALAQAIRDMSGDSGTRLPYKVKIIHTSANRLTLEWVGRS